MLLNTAFQIAYVTSDLDRACAMVDEKFGVRRLVRQDRVTIGTDQGPMVLGLAHGWLGPTWLEIIEPVEGAVAVYRDWLAQGATFRFHHIGIRAPDPEAYDQAMGEALAAGHSLSFKIDNPLFQAFYVDTTRELGHYIEYLHFTDTSFMAAIPQNVAA